MDRTITSASEADTQAEAVRLAATMKGGDVLLLEGDLGSGKTVFARALIRALAGDSALEVPSPTFTLVQTYDTPRGMVWHFDLYRLEEPEEIYEIGWEEALAGGIVVVEWPERLGGLLPENCRKIRFENTGESARRLVVKEPEDR
jgi:tRNA threonylcarbamoyladenosine biosynthesis protein TsaE